MPRISRLINGGEKTAYHVMSRTALPDFPFEDVEKDEFVKILKRLSRVYFAEIHGYAVMGNHFHILVTMRPEAQYSDEAVKNRYRLYYGEDAVFPAGRMKHLRQKWASLSEFVREIKQTFSRFYNKNHKRRGTLWGERFKSVIVERGETLVNCLAYIDLNAVRAGLVTRPEDYRWCSLGYHVQTGNSSDFLSTDFGLSGFGDMDEAERLRRYRRYVYESGADECKDGKSTQHIPADAVQKERGRDYELPLSEKFLKRTRYFADSGIIGSKAFVSEKYQKFKHVFQSKHEKKPKPVKGLNGMYSLKKLTA